MNEELLLLARARRLESEALTEVHQQYYAAIFRYIAFRVHDRMAAEDLTSEVFTRFLSALRDKNAPQNTLRGWLFGVAARVVVDYYRQKGRTPETPLSDLEPSQGDSLEDVIEKRLSVVAMQAALHDLTPEQQQVLSLRFGSGLRIREVADMLGKSEGAVKQLQLRAIATLTQQLAMGADGS